jgi:hypothetical protein
MGVVPLSARHSAAGPLAGIGYEALDVPKIYQVFVGCPFGKEIRRNYDRLKKDLEAETPVSVVLADTVGISSSDYLLEHITELIHDSAGCIFDATGANPNVSLEVGIAHTIPTDFILTLKTRKPRAGKGDPPTPEVRSIISDLQGKNRIEYKTYKTLRSKLEEQFLGDLPYMVRWKRFKNERKGMVPYVLRFFADVRTSSRSTGPRLQAILDGSGFTVADVRNAMRAARLISVQRGRKGGYYYPVK